MLNLSDKELDRLSREAAQEHDPGDVLGPRSWEKLEPRLDTDLGKTGSNPLRGVRRFPYYYAPAAILLVAGVIFFTIQNHRSGQNKPTGSPPTATSPATQSISLPQNSEHSTNSTPSTSSSTTADPTAVGATQNDATNAAAATNGAGSNTTGSNTTSSNPTGSNPTGSKTSTSNPTGSTTGASTASGSNPTGSTTSGSNPNGASTTSGYTPTGASTPSGYTPTGSATNASTAAGGASTTGTNRASAGIAPTGATPHTRTATDGSLSNTTTTRSNSPRNHKPGRNSNSRILASKDGATAATTNPTTAGTTNPTTRGNTNPTTAGATPNNPPSAGNTTPPAKPTAPRELTHANLPKTRQLRQRPTISDSALRAYTAKTSTIQIGKSKSLRINRTLQFGLSLAPDFSSVNSLAGDKPGSTIGFTLDYQFANRWYLSTGLLLDRKNYAARAQDYHVPYDYYRLNGIHNLDFVKGTFSMLEIPLNLRYDFSVAGNTLFFASAGFSSYLRTNENCNYYFNAYGPGTNTKSFTYSNNNNYLFSTVNLSIGVETGISDDLSLLVAPYIKLPSQNIGFGQISMSSVGVTFALKFAPVISKRRK